MSDTNFVRCTHCKSPVGCMAAKVCRNEGGADAPQKSAPEAAEQRLASDAEAQAMADAARREAAASALALSRLCRDCTHCVKPMVGGWTYSNCKSPHLPVNLVTGSNVFPCYIARGYEQLCGPLGRLWRART